MASTNLSPETEVGKRKLPQSHIWSQVYNQTGQITSLTQPQHYHVLSGKHSISYSQKHFIKNQTHS